MRGVFRGTPAIRAIRWCRWMVTGTVAAVSVACSEQGSFVDRVAADPAAAASDALGSGSVAGKFQLAIEPAEARLLEGESKSFQAFLIGQDGQKKDVTALAEWSVLPAAGAAVSPAGLVVAETAGSYKVAAQTGSLAGTADLTVVAPDHIPNPTVSVRANGHDHATTVAAGIPLRIEWATEDVGSCRVLSNGTEIANGPSGQVTAVASNSTEFDVVCVTDAGDPINDSVQVTVTRPEVRLTLNGAEGDITMSSGSRVDIDWVSTNASSCAVKVGDELMDTALSGAHAANPTNGATVMVTCVDAAGNRASAQHSINLSDSLRVGLAAGRDDQIAGGSVARPLSIVFALDVTGSMANQIGTVKSGVQAFVSELASRNYAPLVGVIPFRDKVPVPGNPGDVPEGRIELTADSAAVKAFVGTLAASGGGDANEAALGAVREGLAMLRTQDNRPDAVKLIIVVTDHPGHSGGSTVDCSLAPLVTQFADLTETEQRQVKLFYSSPSTGQTCSGFRSGVEQMTALRSQILAAELVEDKRGGLVPWPFAYSNLVTDVVNMIQKVTPPIDISCINREVTLRVDGVEEIKWEVADLAGVFALHEAGQPHVVSQTMPEADFDVLQAAHAAGRAQVDAVRCCVSKAAARAGNFSSCLRSETVMDAPFSFNGG